VLASGWLDAVSELVGERAVDLVLDPVGGDRMTDSLRSLAPEGRLLVLGFAAGEIPTVKVNRLLLGNTAVVGVASREFFDQQPEVVAELWAQLLELRQTGVLPDPPMQLFPFADARGALGVIAGRQARGKVVLTNRGAAPARMAHADLLGHVLLRALKLGPGPLGGPSRISTIGIP
jgi:NADPH:quinone reductase